MKINNWRYYLIRNIYTQILIRIMYFIFDMIILPFKSIATGFMIMFMTFVVGVSNSWHNYIVPNTYEISKNADNYIKILEKDMEA